MKNEIFSVVFLITKPVDKPISATKIEVTIDMATFLCTAIDISFAEKHAKEIAERAYPDQFKKGGVEINITSFDAEDVNKLLIGEKVIITRNNSENNSDNDLAILESDFIE
jgi:hypothetical protein